MRELAQIQILTLNILLNAVQILTDKLWHQFRFQLLYDLKRQYYRVS